MHCHLAELVANQDYASTWQFIADSGLIMHAGFVQKPHDVALIKIPPYIFLPIYSRFTFSGGGD